MLQVGLNPYGLCCTFGLIGGGTGRAAPEPLGLEEFVGLGERIGAKCLEIDIRLLAKLDRDGQAALGDRLRGRGTAPVVAIGMPGDHLADTIGIASAIGASLIRMDLTPVLCGDRASTADWSERVRASRESLEKWAPVAADSGIDFAIENHQDLGSEELLEYAAAAGSNVGICFDTGNSLAVGEDILSFAEKVAPQVRHLHLKDYRAQFTDEGYRLVQCAIGDGCVPLKEIEAILSPYREKLTASLEPGALEARHVRLFTDRWWQGYPPREASELGRALRTARRNRLPDEADWRTPWEMNAAGAQIVEHEMSVFERSVANIRAMGWL